MARSVALHGPAAAAVAERARAQGWCWRDAQEVGVGDGVVVESSCVRPRFFIWRVWEGDRAARPEITRFVHGSQEAAEPELEAGEPRLVRTASAGERRRRAAAEVAAGAAEAATVGVAQELAVVRGQIEQMRR